MISIQVERWRVFVLVFTAIRHRFLIWNKNFHRLVRSGLSLQLKCIVISKILRPIVKRIRNDIYLFRNRTKSHGLIIKRTPFANNSINAYETPERNPNQQNSSPNDTIACPKSGQTFFHRDIEKRSLRLHTIIVSVVSR